jgi:hypothetical protein
VRKLAFFRDRNWRKYQSEDKLEVRNPGGYLNTLCATLVFPTGMRLLKNGRYEPMRPGDGRRCKRPV